MPIFCVSLMTFGLGFFTAFFLYGWFEERSDRYDRIPWSGALDTCIDWHVREGR